MPIYSRPGVFQLEVDLSQVVREAASDIGVTVSAFAKGPINKRILITNTRDFITLFGQPDVAFGYGGYCGICAMETMDKLYVTRVVSSDSNHAAGIVNISGSATDFDAVTNGLSLDDQDQGIEMSQDVGVGNSVDTTFTDTLNTFDEVLTLTDIQVGGTSIGPLTINTAVVPWTISSPDLSGTSSTVHPTTGALSLVFDAGSIPGDGDIITAYFTGASADRLFTVSAENPGEWGNNLKITVTNINATAFTFDLNVFETVDGVNVLRESHTVSRKHQLDGFGRQQYLEDVINGNSIYIRVFDKSEVADDELPDEISTPVSLTGGDNGSALSSADVMAGWDLYENRQDIQIDILINSGYVGSSDFTVQTKMKSIAESRDDCFAILDAPFSELKMSPTTDLIDWRNTTQNFNSSYTALYSPWVEVYDSYNDIRNFPIPPSGFVAQVFARRAKNTEAWFPPAGFNDGIIDSGQLPFTRLTHRYTEGQQDLIYTAGVNYLLTEPGTGTAVFGDKTQQTMASALDRINVRRLLNVTKRAAREFLKFKLFELNTEFTRNQITEALTDYYRGVQARQGVTDFRVICNETNNTPNVIDNNQLNVDTYIQPTKSINFIQHQTVITRTGVDFQTIINARLPA